MISYVICYLIFSFILSATYFYKIYVSKDMTHICNLSIPAPDFFATTGLIFSRRAK